MNPIERWWEWGQDETYLIDTWSTIIQVKDVKPRFSLKSRDCKTFKFCSICITLSRSLYNFPVYKRKIYGPLSN